MRKYLPYVLGLLLLGCKNTLPSKPATEEHQYETEWTDLMAQNQTLSFDADVTLSETEVELEKMLLNTRKKILEKASQEKIPLFSRSFNEIRPFIDSSQLYQLLKSMPKGGLLHSHSGGIADAHWVIATAKRYPECYVFEHQDTPGYLYGQLAFFEKGKIPSGFVNLQNKITADPAFENQLYKLLTLERNSLTAYMDYWAEFEKRFKRIGLLLPYRPFFQEYYLKAMEDLAKDHVQHLEIRFIFGNLYDFQHGEYPQETMVTDLQEILMKVRKNTPEFSLKLIYTSFKFLDVANMEKQLEAAFKLKQKYPQMISGFDLVADEATGNSIYFFRKNWSKIDSLEKKYGVEMPLFLHAGESNSIFDTNGIDVPLLKNKRIGHGLNLVCFPQVMKGIREQGQLVEISPISNQILGYVSDMRNHPARVLLSHGIQCAINSDDPGVYGYDGLSYDFWMAFVAWELDLRALKKLVFNSITYSSLNENEKRAALSHLQDKWGTFVGTVNQKLN